MAGFDAQNVALRSMVIGSRLFVTQLQREMEAATLIATFANMAQAMSSGKTLRLIRPFWAVKMRV